eukprot:621191-Amphidinium_carterae.1
MQVAAIFHGLSRASSSGKRAVAHRLFSTMVESRAEVLHCYTSQVLVCVSAPYAWRAVKSMLSGRAAMHR